MGFLQAPFLSFAVVPLLLSGIGCVDDSMVGNSRDRADNPISFREFKDSLYCEPGTKACIVQGDIPVFGDEALRKVFERVKSIDGALTVMRTDSVDAIWDRTQRNDLTFCVSKDFGQDYDRIVNVMREAASDWQAHAKVSFRHVVDQDGSCDVQNNRVLFDVSPADPFSWYFARAFFPDSPREERQVLINVDTILESDLHETQGGKLTMRGVLRHELGHTLGFRHEHIRPESPGSYYCYEDDDFRTVTEYDARSTMHYPQCEGEGDWSLALTKIDEQGARFFYPDYERFRGDRCTVEVKGNGELNEACEPIIHEVLELANTASFEILDSWVGLDVRAVESIEETRSAAPLVDLASLRGTPYLDKATLRKMYNYLYVDGRCPTELDNEGRVDILCRPIVHRVLELANKASLVELDEDAKLDSRAAANIISRRTDAPFVDMVDLWSVSYVKARALSKMYRYIYE